MKYSWRIYSHPQGPSGGAKGRKERRVGRPGTGVRGGEQAGERRQRGLSGKIRAGRALVRNLRWSTESLSASDPKGIEERA